MRLEDTLAFVERVERGDIRERANALVKELEAERDAKAAEQPKVVAVISPGCERHRPSKLWDCRACW
jgi:hypothetical protein